MGEVTAGSDFSRGSDAALRLAAAWAARSPGPLNVVHAHEGAGHDALARALAGQAARCTGGARCEIAEGSAAGVLRARGTVVVGAEGASATLLPRAGHVAAELAQDGPPALLVAPLGLPRADRLVFDRVLVACALRDPPRDAVLLEAAGRLLRG